MLTELEDFCFEEDQHRYLDAAGLVVPGVTETLKLAGVYDFSMVDPELLEFKRQLGSNVHAWSADVDRYGLADVDPTSVTPLELGYGRGWLNFCADVRPKFLAIEEPRMRTIAGVRKAGTMDRIALIGRRMWVVDIKCSAGKHPGWGLQLADYEMLWTGNHRIGALGRMIVCLLGDGKYRTITYSDPVDAVVSLAAGRWVQNPADEASWITVDNWKKNKGIWRDNS